MHIVGLFWHVVGFFWRILGLFWHIEARLLMILVPLLHLDTETESVSRRDRQKSFLENHYYTYDGVLRLGN